MSGKVLGPWMDGTCVVVDDSEKEARAYQALNAKYGLMMKMGTFFRRRTGSLDKRMVLEITLSEA
jgi:hypothetical protein